MGQKIIKFLENLVFGNRLLILILFAIITGFMGYRATELKVDAGFEKQLPLQHPYMQTFIEHQASFGGANRILIALEATEGDIFTPEFMTALQSTTREISQVTGVDPSRVSSIFTPDVRFIEIVAGGFEGGQVIPADFIPENADEDDLAQIRENIIKSGQVGRLVANDFTAAIISAQLAERDPTTGERLDYLEVAEEIESHIRAPFINNHAADNLDFHVGTDIHVIGFAQAVGDIANGALGVLIFFGLAIIITSLMVYLYTHSIRLTILPIICSLVAVTWQLGLLVTLGYGLDPMSILIPFLVFAVGVSHGVQMNNAYSKANAECGDSLKSARFAFRRLLVPGGIALASDTIGFLTILFIQIRMIQELAITASLGVAVIIFTNLLLLPILLSYIKLGDKYNARKAASEKSREKIWKALSNFARPKFAYPIIIISIILFAVGIYGSQKMAIGDLHAGVPELRPDSRYNQDTAFIAAHFDIGVDILQVIAEAPTSACIDYDSVDYIDRFEWHIQNVEGVQSALSLPHVMRLVSAGWSEGNLRMRVLARNWNLLQQASNDIPSSTGLLDTDCKIMPIMIFTENHKAETIDRIIEAIADFEDNNPPPIGPRYPDFIRFIDDDTYIAPYAAWLHEPQQIGQFEINQMPAFTPAMAESWGFTTENSNAEIEQALLDTIIPYHVENPEELVKLRLATGNVGVMAATNQAVSAAQFPILLWVYSAIIILCLLTFRSIRATLCTVLPLTLVSALCYALMAWLDIGLKVSTLPVAALGAGIGVDYGIYIFSTLKINMAKGLGLQEAYQKTLSQTGSAVIFTGITLAIGVSTWFFSALKFQADMGLLLTFMFLVNMLGAIIILPALAAIFYGKKTA